MSRKIIITMEDLNKEILSFLTEGGYTFARIFGMVREALTSGGGLEEDTSIKD